jgi:uncharacterized membrane protein YwzB
MLNKKTGIYFCLSVGLILAIFGLSRPLLAAAVDIAPSSTNQGALWNTVQGQMDAVAGVTGDNKPTGDPRLIAAYAIRVIVTFLGIIFLVLMLISGYWFFTAHGEEEKVIKAMGTAKRAVFGLIIIILAYAITTFVINGLQPAISGELTGDTGAVQSEE